MTNPSVLIIGARSDIGLAVAHRFAAAGHPVKLAARNSASLERDRTDIELRHGVEATLHECDVLNTAGYDKFIEGLGVLPQTVLCAVGLLGDQKESQNDPLAATLVMRSNFEGPAAILGLFANLFEQRGSGTLVGISSVAGDRGRATNYIYGAAKAGFTAFLSGLRNRLAKRGVHVLTVLPGFVQTSMTAGMDLPAKLTAQPAEVADHVFKAVERSRNIIYVKPVWFAVMAIIRNIPEFIFKRLKL